MNSESAKSYLLNLQSRLREIEKVKDNGVNIFSAVGMQTQEIKHSAFLAWLMRPQSPHGLKNKFLDKLIKKIYAKNKNKVGIYSVEQLNGFLTAEDLKVETEKTIDGIDSRMDIFIQSIYAKTVIVIENKVFTTTHDNQLKRYEDKLNNLDENEWKKVFIYLTPKGDKPTENGKENEKWAILSYSDILEVVSELLRGKLDDKVRFLMEDYTAMVENNILKGNKDLRAICKQIRREHKEALEILMQYTDNADDVMAHCAEWSRRNFAGVTVIKEAKRNFAFCPAEFKNFFEAKQESIINDDGTAKLQISFGYSETVAVGISLQKNKNNDWSPAQKLIIENFAPNKITSDKYISLNGISSVLVSANEREVEFEEIKQPVEEKLKAFGTKVKDFEALLNNL